MTRANALLNMPRAALRAARAIDGPTNDTLPFLQPSENTQELKQAATLQETTVWTRALSAQAGFEDDYWQFL